jgi:hypothetical protein
VSPVKYELGFYIPEDDILHSHCREKLKSYIALTGLALQRRRNVSIVRFELGFYIFIVTAVKTSDLIKDGNVFHQMTPRLGAPLLPSNRGLGTGML